MLSNYPKYILDYIFGKNLLLMKFLLTLIFLTFISVSISAQIYIEGQSLDNIYDGKYIQVECTSFGNRVRIDFGLSRNDFTLFKVINDENGNPHKFNNAVEVLNFFDENGWELVSVYSDTASFFMQRKE